MTEFSKRLQKLMDEQGFSPTDVVQRSKLYDEEGKGVSKVNMSQWLSGTYTPKIGRASCRERVLRLV